MPVAQKSGKLLAHRIHSRITGQTVITDKMMTDYNLIPTTVFSQTEYSFVGLSEQEAIAKHGEEDIEVYHREVTPLEFSIVKNNMRTAYMKVICVKSKAE